MFLGGRGPVLGVPLRLAPRRMLARGAIYRLRGELVADQCCAVCGAVRWLWVVVGPILMRRERGQDVEHRHPVSCHARTQARPAQVQGNTEHVLPLRSIALSL